MWPTRRKTVPAKIVVLSPEVQPHSDAHIPGRTVERQLEEDITVHKVSRPGKKGSLDNGDPSPSASPRRGPSKEPSPRRSPSKEPSPRSSSPRPLSGSSTRSPRSRAQSGEASDITTVLDPKTLGLRGYAAYELEIPFVGNDVREDIRDITAVRALHQLGVLDSMPYTSSALGPMDFDVSMEKLKAEMRASEQASSLDYLAMDVQAQLHSCVYFRDELVPVVNRGCGAPGKQDCLAVPVSFEYGASFAEFPAGSSSQPAGFEPTCWVLHVVTPRLGDSSLCDDFFKLVAPQKGRTGWFGRQTSPDHVAQYHLNEDLYIDHMYHLFLNAFSAMGQLGISDAVLHPIGVTAALNNLFERDEHYRSEEAMRSLRERTVECLIRACGDLCSPTYLKKVQEDPDNIAGTKWFKRQGPKRIHVCLSTCDAESIETHNVFVDTFARCQKELMHSQDSQTYRGTSFIRLYKNLDIVQLAHNISEKSGERSCVCIVNETSPKGLGGNWLEADVSPGVDEDLHRRSASLARTSIFFNVGVSCMCARSESKAGQLAEVVHTAGGQVMSLDKGSDLFAEESASKKLHTQVEADLKQQIKHAFHEADTNADGVISLEEISGLFRFLGGWTEAHLSKLGSIFEHIDSNRDGVVDFDELVDWIMGDSSVQVDHESRKPALNSSVSKDLQGFGIRHKILDHAAISIQKHWRGKQDRSKCKAVFSEIQRRRGSTRRTTVG